ncbi:MAG: hypothetical protein MUF72_03295 [Elainella sp. Prado103]|jgi:hypothetical protein|nr:hypothetical protein [Elainella sp. Prado103]
MRFETGEPLHLPALPPYESALLSSLAFFRQQERTTQALNCLTMYLRQSETRVMGEIRFYAGLLHMEPEALLMLIDQDPQQAAQLIQTQLQSNLPAAPGSDLP